MSETPLPNIRLPGLSENQVLHLQPDLIHTIKTATGKIIYSGWLHEGAEEDTPNGCIIRRTTITENGDETIVETKFANSNNQRFAATWNNRQKENYLFSRK